MGSDDDGYAVRLKLKHFAHYLASPVHSRDDSPLYIFDGTFADRDMSRSASSALLVRLRARLEVQQLEQGEGV